MYCFSGVVVIGVNSCRVFAFRSFSQSIKARAMKRESCIQLDECSSKLPSILCVTSFMVH